MTVVVLEHVLVLCDDIERTRDFYCDVVGLAVGERPPLEFPGYWLYAGATASVHVAERRAYASHAAGLGLAVPSAGAGVGPVDHVAFRAGSGDYDELLERLSRAGIEAVTNAVPGGPRQVFIEDPNGVRVEINFMTQASPSGAPDNFPVSPEDEAR
ncbi:MAG TPA: VOC family protein [Solirubrobacteraceae bacterium]|nr:VOC family protein [Solirubrobacteraceae bacterium]